MNFEGTRVFVQVDGDNAFNLPGLLYVGAMGSDRQAHEIFPYTELLRERGTVLESGRLEEFVRWVDWVYMGKPSLRCDRLE